MGLRLANHIVFLKQFGLPFVTIREAKHEQIMVLFLLKTFCLSSKRPLQSVKKQFFEQHFPIVKTNKLHKDNQHCLFACKRGPSA